MRRQLLIWSIALGVVLALWLLGVLALAVSRSAPVRSYLVRRDHPDYVAFLHNGATLCTPDLLQCLGSDPDRDAMVRGRSVAELRARYPFLVPASAFPVGSHKHDADPRAGIILWFSADDGMDWCVDIHTDTSTSRVRLMKG